MEGHYKMSLGTGSKLGQKRTIESHDLMHFTRLEKFQKRTTYILGQL